MMKIKRGFTLLEILIAVAIFSVIGIASYSVLSTVIDSDEISSARIAKLEQLQRAMLYIERDMLQAVPRAVRVNGENSGIVLTGGEEVLDSDADGIGLVRGGWQNPQLILPRSTLQTVGYRLRDNQLERLYSNYVDNVIGYEPKVKVLLDEVDDFQVQFLGGGNGRRRDGGLPWEDSFQGNQLPRAIAIEISTAEFGLLRREFVLAGQAG